VLYTIAAEIDRDPLALLRLHGVNWAASRKRERSVTLDEEEEEEEKKVKADDSSGSDLEVLPSPSAREKRAKLEDSADETVLKLRDWTAAWSMDDGTPPPLVDRPDPGAVLTNVLQSINSADGDTLVSLLPEKEGEYEAMRSSVTDLLRVLRKTTASAEKKKVSAEDEEDVRQMLVPLTSARVEVDPVTLAPVRLLGFRGRGWADDDDGEAGADSVAVRTEPTLVVPWEAAEQLLAALPASLLGDVSASVAALALAVALTRRLCARGCIVAELATGYTVTWKPALVVDAVSRAVDQLATLLPLQAVGSTTGQTVSVPATRALMVLAAMTSARVVATFAASPVLVRQATSGLRQPLVDLLFRGRLQSLHRPSERGIASAVATFFRVFQGDRRDYRPMLRLGHSSSDSSSFVLSVWIAEDGRRARELDKVPLEEADPEAEDGHADDEVDAMASSSQLSSSSSSSSSSAVSSRLASFVPLCDVLSSWPAQRRLRVLQDLGVLLRKLPELSIPLKSGGKRAASIPTSRLHDLLVHVRPVLSLLGASLLLPRALHRARRPRAVLALSIGEGNEAALAAAASSSSSSSSSSVSSSAQDGGFKGFLDAWQVCAGYDWKVALGGWEGREGEGDELLLSAGEFEQLCADARGLAVIQGRYVLADSAEVASVLKAVEKGRAGRALSATELLRGALSGTVDGVDVTFASKQVRAVVEGALASRRTVAAPAGLQATLRPYQLTGYQWLVSLASLGLGGILADDMGLGKTVQALALLLRLQEDRGATGFRSLVVVPTSLLAQWAKEADRFAPSLNVSVYHGPNRVIDVGSALVVTTYGTVRSDRTPLARAKFDVILLDEAQTIKNAATATSTAVRSLAAPLRFALSGTPVENSVGDYFATLDFVLPGLFGTAASFRARFVRPIERDRSPNAIRLLTTSTRPFVLRRLRTDVLKDLPPLVEDTIVVNLTPEQAALYRAETDKVLALLEEAAAARAERARAKGAKKAKDARQSSIDVFLAEDVVEAEKEEEEEEEGEEDGVTIVRRATLPVSEEVGEIVDDGDVAQRGRNVGMSMLRLLTRLKLICNHPALYAHSSTGTALGDDVDAGRSGKTDLLLTSLAPLLSSTTGGKVLIFSQYRTTLQLLQRLIERRFPATVGRLPLYSGAASGKSRAAMVDAFQTEPDIRLMLVSLRAGGVGLNLTAASTVFFFDSFWNPAVMQQAHSRAHRLGQARTVFVKTFLCRGTVEQKIADLLTHKANLASLVAGKGEGWLADLGTDELRHLFSFSTD
jgi:hypothetical protein